MLGGTALTVQAASGPSSSHDGYLLKNSLIFNTYGQFQVNETLIELSNSTTGISSVTFGFPSAFGGHSVAQSADVVSGGTKSEATISQSVSNNTLLLTVSLPHTIPAGTNATVNLGFYVVNTFVATNGSNYNVPMLFYPSVSMTVNKIATQIVLPYLTSHVAVSTPLRTNGFSQTVNGSAEIWSNTFTNASYPRPSFAEVNVYSDPITSGSFDFTSVSRQISIDSSGSLIVQDSITVRNNGENTVTSIDYSPLTNSSTVTLLPSSETLLSNVKSTTLTGGQLSLSDINAQIEPGSSVTVIIQYPLSNQFWSFSNGEYTVKIPASAPVNAIVDRYQLSTKASSGIIFTNGTGPAFTLTNTTAGSVPVSFSYRLGIGSAYGSAIPVAALLFIAVFGLSLAFKPRKTTEEGAVDILDSLIRMVEDKVSGTNDILSDLKSKGATVTRNDLVTSRSRIDEFRNKFAGRFGALRSQLASPSVTIQSGLNQISANDREFDKIVRDELNGYDQFISKRMKEDTFLRVTQSYERRLQQVTNAYLDSVHDLREEYESES